MRRIRLPILSLRYYWRSNLAVLLGMAVGTAVLTGALIVGDSIRGSLRQMTLERLGKVDYALTSPGFFRQALAEDLARSEGFGRNFSSAQTAILLRGSIENAETSAFSRGVQIIGVDQHFWELDSFSTQPPHIAGRRAAINSALAHAIGVKTGGSVLLRLDRPDAIPADAVAGRKSERIETLRLDVEQILRDRGFGRFGLFSGQQTPLNIFVPMETLQRQFKLVGKVNALLLVAKGEREEAGADQSSRLQSLIRQSAQIEDLGLRARANVSPSYVSVESARMVLNDAEIAAIQDSATTLGLEFAPTLTYLANLIQLGDKEIPYSTIAAINPAANAPLGPLRLVDDYAAEKLNPNEILINEWAAKELGAKKGDRLRFSYFVDGPRGQLKTVTSDDFIVTGTVAMAGPANDPGLTPEYPGINDAKNMRDWNPPFPVDLSKIRDADEAYWKDHKATPKAFIALETGLKMWSSRFGKLTSIRVASTGAEPAEYTAVRLAEEIRKRLEPKNAGLVFQPVKLRGLQASEGTSDFAQLFIGFSFFIIIAAMLLVRLFFSLGVERRAREIGILMAAGFTGGQVRRLMMFEGAILAFIGGAAGVWIGKGYAWLMLYGLRTWWIGAVGTTFLELHADPLSLKIGFGAGVAVGLLSVFFAARGFTRA
ncbi:ABC transporter permease, partial [Candidatus Sumerlaeota bacterium]|nr:ABC transporter permease [Candidatus Sumerlaeota bacterium]